MTETSPTSNAVALVERLNAREKLIEFPSGRVFDGDPINPDGPEAADVIQSQAARIAELEGERQEEIAWTVMLLDLEEDGDWPDGHVNMAMGYSTQPHSGDCTKQPWTCMRCRADRAYAIADRVIARQARSLLSGEVLGDYAQGRSVPSVSDDRPATNGRVGP